MSVSLGNAILYFKGNMDGLNKSLGDAQRQTNRSMGNILKVTDKVGTAFLALGTSLASGMVVGMREAFKFEKSMASLATLGVKDMGALRDGIQDVSMEFGVNLYDAVEQTYQALSAGIPEDAAIMVLEAATKGAYAGMGSLTDAMNIGTGMMNAYGLKTDDAVETTKNFEQIMGLAATAVRNGKTTFADMGAALGRLAPMASAAGMSMEELFASVAAVTGSGLQTTEAISGLKAALTNIIKPGKEASAAANALELDFTSAALKTKGWEGFLADVIARVREGGPEVVKLAGAMKQQIDASEGTRQELAALKKSYKALQGVTEDELGILAQLFSGVEGLNAILALTSQQGAATFKQSLLDMGNAQANLNEMSQAYIDANPDIAFDALKESVRILGIEMAVGLIPAFRQWMEGIQGNIEWLVGFVREHENLVVAIGSTTVKIIAASLALGGFLKIIGPLIKLHGLLAGAALGLTASWGILAIATGALVIQVYRLNTAFWEWKKATQTQEESEGRLQAAVAQTAAYLDEEGIAYDRVAMAQMSQIEQSEYLNKVLDEAKGKTSAVTAVVHESTDAIAQKTSAIEEDTKATETNAIMAGRSTDGIKRAYMSMGGEVHRMTSEARKDLEKLSLDTPGSPTINEMAAQSFSNYEGMLQGLVGNVSSIIGSMRSAWESFFSWLASAMPGGKPSMPMGYARGGRVGSHATILAGELGPEWARYPGGGGAMLGAQGPGLYSVPVGTMISTANQTMAMMAQSFARGGRVQPQAVGGVVINLTMPGMVIREEADVDRISRAIARRVRSPLLGAV